MIVRGTGVRATNIDLLPEDAGLVLLEVAGGIVIPHGWLDAWRGGGLLGFIAGASYFGPQDGTYWDIHNYTCRYVWCF